MDVKTLRLASIQLTAPLLEQFLSYQRCLIVELEKSASQTDWNGRFAFAHSHALTVAKLDANTYGKLKSLVGDWCGRQTALAQVKARLEVAKSAPAPSAKDQAIVERARRELPVLEDFSEFTERYGAQAVELLTAHGDDVVRLHRDVARQEGCSRI